jgi:hypothetical protein
MTVEDFASVDGVGTDCLTQDTVLTISDHLPWDRTHLVVLEKKLAAYVRFVENGQLVEARPDSLGSRVTISLIAQFRPTPDAANFLDEASRALAIRGLGFRYGPIPSQGYIDDAD